MTDRPTGIRQTVLSLLPPVGLSFSWLIFVWLYLSRQNDSVFQLKPNDFGDFFAGVFAPLAFVWFGYAVFLQSRELRLQRSELALTRSELALTRQTHEHAVAEQQRMVEQQAEQTRIMTAELEKSREAEATLLLKKHYDFVISKFSVPISRLGVYQFYYRRHGGGVTHSSIDFRNSIAEQIATGNEYLGYIATEKFLEGISSQLNAAGVVEPDGRDALVVITKHVGDLSDDLEDYMRSFATDQATAIRMRLNEIASLASGIKARASDLLEP